MQAGVNGNGAGPQPAGNARALLTPRGKRLVRAILILMVVTSAFWVVFSAIGHGSASTGTGDIAPKTSTP